MTQTLHDIELQGCAPTPLAHYLKALGILRLVSEQIPESNAKGWWKNDSFWLRSTLDREHLVEFFSKQYCPTPIVAPWNGGSGFYPKDNRDAFEAIQQSNHPQFHEYQQTLQQCQKILAHLGLDEKPANDVKPNLLQACRNQLPDPILPWLDAAYLLTSDGPKYPPLLGTGGNDGRLEFTNNYMQHLVSILPVEESSPCLDELRESLFATSSNVRHSGTIGQFDPGNLGGANNGTGFDGSSTVNSWDYVFMLEGALVFAAASVKKLESSEIGTLAYPFCVRSTGVGYESSSNSDEEAGRSEMWLPLWCAPATFHSITTLLSEGRVETNRRRASNGVDFARAISELGVDRGIEQFQRFGFHQRNGLAYLAVPIGRFDVHANPSVSELLSPIDRWLAKLRRAATSNNAPASAGRALRAVESAILELCERGSAQDVQQLLIALGSAETIIATSPKLRTGEKGSGLEPVPLLGKQWLDHLSKDSTVEFRLAAALASVWHSEVGPIRKHVEPIDCDQLKRQRARWLENANSPSIVWTSGDLVRNMNAVLKRRLIEVMQTGKQNSDKELLAPFGGKYFARLDDIAAFIDKRTDDQRIAELFRGLMLMKWGDFSPCDSIDHSHESPDATYALLKLCFLDRSNDEISVKLQPQIAYRAMAGNASEATQLAARRLRSSGVPPAIHCVHVAPDRMRRVSAALLFPLAKRSVSQLKESVLAKHLSNKRESETHI